MRRPRRAGAVARHHVHALCGARERLGGHAPLDRDGPYTSGRNESGGTAFDPKAYYSYSLDPADRVPSIVSSGSGPSSAIGAAG
ncbi:hypothetical protein AB0D24_38860 [Streptomyces javensis]|uniref:hypothetical protein n=1 Tax=Streptomyces javensis TaxID=114698 RepID=UPI0033EE6DC9